MEGRRYWCPAGDRIDNRLLLIAKSRWSDRLEERWQGGGETIGIGLGGFEAWKTDDAFTLCVGIGSHVHSS